MDLLLLMILMMDLPDEVLVHLVEAGEDGMLLDYENGYYCKYCPAFAKCNNVPAGRARKSAEATAITAEI